MKFVLKKTKTKDAVKLKSNKKKSAFLEALDQGIEEAKTKKVSWTKNAQTSISEDTDQKTKKLKTKGKEGSQKDSHQGENPRQEGQAKGKKQVEMFEGFLEDSQGFLDKKNKDKRGLETTKTAAQKSDGFLGEREEEGREKGRKEGKSAIEKNAAQEQQKGNRGVGESEIGGGYGQEKEESHSLLRPQVDPQNSHSASMTVAMEQKRRIPVLSDEIVNLDLLRKARGKVPGRICDKCYLADDCAGYEAGSVCAYNEAFSSFPTRDAATVLEGMRTIVTDNYERLEFAKHAERVAGAGQIDPNVTRLSEVVLGQSTQLLELNQELNKVSVTVTGDPSSTKKTGGILSAIFGANLHKQNDMISLQSPDAILRPELPESIHTQTTNNQVILDTQHIQASAGEIEITNPQMVLDHVVEEEGVDGVEATAVKP